MDKGELLLDLEGSLRRPHSQASAPAPYIYYIPAASSTSTYHLSLLRLLPPPPPQLITTSSTSTLLPFPHVAGQYEEDSYVYPVNHPTRPYASAGRYLDLETTLRPAPPYLRLRPEARQALFVAGRWIRL